MSIILLFFIGTVSGVASAYLGIGGGIILVPILTEILFNTGLSLDQTMTSAFATAMFIAVFTTASSSFRQYRQNNIVFSAIPYTAAGAISGGWLGAWLGSNISGRGLTVMFGSFLILASINLFISSSRNGKKKNITSYRNTGFVILGLITGILAALFGIGGGIIMIPIFVLLFGLPAEKVAGTSSSIAFFLSISSVIAYLIFGVGRAAEGAGFWGVIDLSLAVPIAIGTTLTAPIGAILNKRYKGATYLRIFASFLLIVAFRMLLR